MLEKLRIATIKYLLDNKSSRMYAVKLMKSSERTIFIKLLSHKVEYKNATSKVLISKLFIDSIKCKKSTSDIKKDKNQSFVIKYKFMRYLTRISYMFVILSLLIYTTPLTYILTFIGTVSITIILLLIWNSIEDKFYAKYEE